MSRRQASSSGTVSLFPFLAVLVCAMGALILLLLVTTRRIRQQSLLEDAIVCAPEPSMSAPASSTRPLPDVVDSSAPESTDPPLLPLLASDPPSPSHDPRPALLDELATLHARQSQLASEVAQRRQELARLDTAAAGHSATLAQQEATSAEHAAEKKRLNDLYIRLRQQQEQTEQRAEDLHRRVQQTRAQLAEADSKFTVVPYDGNSGTTRRPIIIECTAESLTFVSEGVSLTARDLNGFPARYNPLLYVTQALVRYWERQQRTQTDLGKPYVMLVVRPGGTTGYYVARGLLEPMDETFGYELVTEDQQFSWPPSDPEASAICRTIIDKMLAERDAMMDAALRGGAQLGKYSNDQGEFQLAEIERLKNPTREVTINGQQFSREPQTFSSLSRSGRGASEDAPAPRSTWGSPPDSAGPTGTGASSPGTSPAAMQEADKFGAPASSGVYTQQNSAVTRADRMPEWLREGTTRLDTPPSATTAPKADGSLGTSDIDPFADRSDTATSAVGAAPAVESQPAGRNESFDAQATTPQAPPANDAPPERLDFAQDRTRDARSIDNSQPQWGPRSGSGLIGFEKQVRITVSATQISIGEHSAFQCDTTTSIADLRHLLAGGINREVRSWGAAPKSFYWVPAIHFAVTPDGRMQHERLKKIIKGWELQTSVEYIDRS